MHIIVSHANVVLHGWMLTSICTFKKSGVTMFNCNLEGFVALALCHFKRISTSPYLSQSLRRGVLNTFTEALNNFPGC